MLIGVKPYWHEKEVHEHRVVIDSILRRLKSIGLENCHEGKPRLLRLANLQHVRTPLRVESHDNIHPFDALAALHPTPAMGGSPREMPSFGSGIGKLSTRMVFGDYGLD